MNWLKPLWDKLKARFPAMSCVFYKIHCWKLNVINSHQELSAKSSFIHLWISSLIPSPSESPP